MFYILLTNNRILLVSLQIGARRFHRGYVWAYIFHRGTGDFLRMSLFLLHNSDNLYVLKLPFEQTVVAQVRMTLNLQAISSIDKFRKLTVYGYIRTQEKENNLEIPKSIILVMILFYGDDTDEWDPESMCKYVKVLDDKTITREIEGFYGSSYGKVIIESGVFKWRLKINECKKYGFLLGIRRVDDEETKLPIDTWFTKGGYQCGYGFYSRAAILTDKDGYALGKKYGVAPPNGSIIEMVLDLNNLTLSYIINGKDYRKAFDIEKGRYRLGLTMRKVPDSVTLL